MRLFIAIELPEHYKKALGELRTVMPGARWVTAEQIHLTLSFLGEVSEASVGRLAADLAKIRAAGFELRMAGTGCFPNRHHPRVVWVGVAPEPRLTRLAEMVRETVFPFGIPQDERPFSPHITLARLKLPCTGELAAFLGRHGSLNLPPYPVQEFTLFQSQLTQQGAVHIPVRSFPLTAPGSDDSD